MLMIPAEYAPALPEIILGLGICLVLLVDLYLPARLRDVTYLLALATLGGTALAIGAPGVEGPQLAFSGSFVADPLASFLKLFVLALMATVFVYSRASLQDSGYNKGEY